MATTFENKDPLLDFQKLSEGIHLYKPTDACSSLPGAPSLVVLCTWAFAQPRHISKYLRGYRDRYPHAQILLVQSDISSVIWRPEVWQMPMFESAVVAIKDFANSSPSQGLLMHIFSNGGSYTAVQLAQAYRQSISSSSGKGLDLPVAAIVFDSCPSPPRFQLGIKAMAMGLPKTLLAQWFGLAGIYLALGPMALLHQFGIVELFLAKAYRELNGVGGPFLQRGVPRVYVYSQSDAVMLAEDIVEHAREAKALLELKGGEDGMVRVEEFVGSQHCNHVSMDPKRYWGIVRETWEQAVKER